MISLYGEFLCQARPLRLRKPGGVADRFALAGGPILGHPNGTLALDPTAWSCTWAEWCSWSGKSDIGHLDIRKYWNQNRNTRSKDVQNRNMMKYKFHTSQIPAMLSQFPFAAAHEFLFFSFGRLSIPLHCPIISCVGFRVTMPCGNQHGQHATTTWMSQWGTGGATTATSTLLPSSLETLSRAEWPEVADVRSGGAHESGLAK